MLRRNACGLEASSSQAHWQPGPTPQQPPARGLHPHTQWPMSSPHHWAHQRGSAESLPSAYQQPHVTVDLSALEGAPQNLPAVRLPPSGPGYRLQHERYPLDTSNAPCPSGQAWQHQHPHDTHQHGHLATGKQELVGATDAQEQQPRVVRKAQVAPTQPHLLHKQGKGSYPNSPSTSRPGSAGFPGTDESALQQRGIRKQWKAKPAGCD